MMTRLLTSLLFCAALQAQILPLIPQQWVMVEFNSPHQEPIKKLKDGGISFDFPDASTNRFVDYLEFAFDPDHLAGFQSATQNVRFAGFSFGGGCPFGHGVNTSPKTANAEFRVTSYVIQ